MLGTDIRQKDRRTDRQSVKPPLMDMLGRQTFDRTDKQTAKPPLIDMLGGQTFDRQTDRQTGSQTTTDRHAGGTDVGQTVRLTDRHTDRKTTTNGHAGSTDVGQTERQKDKPPFMSNKGNRKPDEHKKNVSNVEINYY